MTIVSVNFKVEHKAMFGHCKAILAHDGGRIAINPTSDRMITSLMTAVDNDGTLYKATTYDGISDAFRLPLKGSG
jgi:hypothetical protein